MTSISNSVWEQYVVVMLEMYGRTKIRVQYIAVYLYCDIIVIVKIMRYDDYSSTLLQCCDNYCPALILIQVEH